MTTPWHLWAVGLVSVLWNGFGVLDYVLTQLRVPAYVANMPAGMLEHMAGYPVWMDGVWALAVWLPFLAALLLLGGRRSAAVFFGLGLVFTLAAGVWNYALSAPPLHAVAGAGVIGLWAVIVVVAALQWLYARTMVQRGVLA